MRKTSILFMAIAACAPQGSSTNDPVAAGAGSSSDAILNVQVSLVDAKGAAHAQDMFAAKADVWMQLQALTTSNVVTAQDYLFEVVDAQGNVVSSDDLACRRFHVTAQGAIDRVVPGTDPSGAQCAHAAAQIAVNAQAATIIQLIPFGDIAKDANGAMQFKLLVAPADQCLNGVFPQGALEVAFTIKPAQTASCGNGVLDTGEECDDGANNGMSSDACGTDCKKHVCGGSASPVCGNGVIEAGEECDDGAANGTNGDACTSQCHATHLCCCGDGQVEPGEECDEGANNGVAGGSCSDTCQSTGNGHGH
jgi:cysteine-rich repeat protein